MIRVVYNINLVYQNHVYPYLRTFLIIGTKHHSYSLSLYLTSLHTVSFSLFSNNLSYRLQKFSFAGLMEHLAVKDLQERKG